MNAPYTVNSYDVCTSGFERLRSRSEFILLASIGPDSTLPELVKELKQDIRSCERFAGFDYAAARGAVDAWAKEAESLFSKPNPFGLEPLSEDDEEGPWCNLYLYIQGPEPVFA